MAPNASDAEAPSIEILEASKRTTTNTFLQASNQTARKGTSIRDHPSTWNHDSDQLADELAALAMELDPAIKEKADAEERKSTHAPRDTAITPPDRDDNYVFETYIRVRHDDQTPDPMDTTGPNNVGVLVIEEEDEDLWAKYVASDDDTDWDEEDSNGKLTKC